MVSRLHFYTHLEASYLHKANDICQSRKSDNSGRVSEGVEESRYDLNDSVDLPEHPLQHQPNCR